MDSVAIAEWIVSRLTTTSRAVSIVGDLAELKPEKGSCWFWLSLAGVVLSLGWRRPLAFLAAFYVGNWAFYCFQIANVGIHTRHRPPDYPWMPVFCALWLVAAVLYAVLFYTAIRFGPRDRLTRFAGCFGLLVAGVIYFWWLPAILASLVLTAALAVSTSMITSQRRWTALALLTTVAVGCASQMLGLYLAALYQNLLSRGRPMGSNDLITHPSLNWVTFSLMLLAMWVTTTACARIHAWLLREKSSGPEMQRESPV